jgi:hypothetical protein
VITALLVLASFNYLQATHNLKFMGKQTVCLVKTVHPCKRKPPAPPAEPGTPQAK